MKSPVILSRAKPLESAKLFRKTERPNLIIQQGEWLDYDGHSYVPIEEATLRADLSEWCDAAKMRAVRELIGEDNAPHRVEALVPFNPKPGDITQILDSLSQVSHRPRDTMSPPCFLDAKGWEGIEPLDLISVNNGILHIRTRALYSSTPNFFTRTAIPIEYDENAPPPARWLDFLNEVTNKRPELVGLLQEMVGYLLSNDTRHQKIFHLWGKTRAGKGTVMRIITDLVGNLNCHNPAIETLAGRFGLQGCIAKSVVMITDMDTENRQALGSAATRLAAISGEDTVTAERKGIVDWNGKLPARLVLASNGLPNFRGHSIALAARLIIIPFDVSFIGRENPTLTEELRAELPGIMNWALDGLARLTERGRFVEPADCIDAKTRMLYASDPIRGFVEERCKLAVDHAIQKAELYRAYGEYCQETGTRPVALKDFSENLFQTFSTVKAFRPRTHSGERAQCYVGIRFGNAEMLRRFKLDAEAVELFGAECVEALAVDDDGFPIPKSGTRDFD